MSASRQSFSSRYFHRLRVVLAEDSIVARIGIRCLLQRCSDIRVVGEAGSGEEVIELVRRLAPDVAVLDWEMPGLAGEEVLARLAGWFPLGRVMVLAPDLDPNRAQAAMAAGVGALVTIPQSADEAMLVGTVRRLAHRAWRNA